MGRWRVGEPAHDHEALMLHLPDVTIVCIDNVAQDLARLALRDTLRLIKPAETLFWTDGGGSEPEFDWIEARELPFHERGREAADQPLWYEVRQDQPFPDRAMGRPGQQVGNGGFSLRSRRLMRFLAERRGCPAAFPEDDLIGRHYRPALEAAGFCFAPVEVAARFSFEHGRPSFPTFGYHDLRNWGWVLSDEEIDARLDAASAYVVKKTELIPQMLKNRDAIRALQGRP